MFLLSPLVVHTLGSVEYGIWSLLGVLTGYMGMLDLGVRASTGRFVIYYLGRDEHRRVDETIRAGLAFYFVAGIIMLVAAVVVAFFFPSVFSSVPAQYHETVRFLLLALVANLWLSAFSGVMWSVLAAHERFDVAQGLGISATLIRAIATVVVLNAGFGLVGLTVVTIGEAAYGALVTWAAAKWVYPPLRVWPFTLNRQRLRELLGYGSAAFVCAIAVKIIGQTDLLVVGWLINVSSVTVYSVGAMAVLYSFFFIRQIGMTFFPPLQRAAARGDMGEIRWLLLRQARLAMVVGILINVGFIFFGRTFIRLWMSGPEFPESAVVQASLVMSILAGSKILWLVTVAPADLLNALGHIRVNALTSVLEALVNLGLSIAFVVTFGCGLTGVAMGTLAAQLLVRTFVIPWYACGKVEIPVFRFLTNVGGSGLLAGSLFACWCFLVLRSVTAATWLAFALQVAVAALGYAPIAFFVLIPMTDRRRLITCLLHRDIRTERHSQADADSPPVRERTTQGKRSVIVDAVSD